MEPGGTSIDPVIAVDGLRLRYRRGPMALDGFAFTVGRGCHGLLGPNGAGKSTLIKVLLGLLKPDGGTGRILGRDIVADRREVRRRVGYMPERDAHVPGMMALDYVALMGELSGLSKDQSKGRSHEVLHYVDLGEARYRPVDGFSAGMKQRLKLAAALVHDPDLLLLDEPTNGLDPKGRRTMLDLVHELTRAGVGILLCTHLLPDVQEVCERVVVASAGRVTREGSVQDLTRGLERSYRVEVSGDPVRFLEFIRERGAVAEQEPGRPGIDIRLPEGETQRLLIEAAIRGDCGLKRLLPGRRTLEEVFMESIEDRTHAHP